MSTTFYRQKMIYDDGLLLHIVNTKGETYFSLSNEHREAGLHILEVMGGQFYYNACGDGIVSIEILLDDILDGIQAIDNGEFDSYNNEKLNFSEKSIDRVRDDFMSMKRHLENDDEDLFILYCL